MRAKIHSLSLYLSWVVAMVAVGGSLFFSEIMGYEPCKLCWLQRICMYPLIYLLGRASYLNDRKIIGYALPLSILGGCISLYHYMEQKVPGFADIMPCTSGIPCSGDYINWLGFITIPFLALIAFILITVFLLLGRSRGAETEEA
ncbi:disulfide oxidoreductase [Paenibacillus nasutitermitis]|uniref:Disulfide bond formation protein C n=1 Tax=Paenibacillus nasutitermitis TaxID=1652958 RepID=A0A916YWH3_9BACL|nr:disulfide oxidoreductase [Paenibacillus nasutitermitis]GGD63093.1 disulfide bond formation protein C [Paenibacillus nasutitermitis]